MVLDERLESVNEVPMTVPIGVELLFLYILYPVTPTLSVEGDQDRSTLEVEGMARRFKGAVGGVVSMTVQRGVMKVESCPYALELEFEATARK